MIGRPSLSTEWKPLGHNAFIFSYYLNSKSYILTKLRYNKEV